MRSLECVGEKRSQPLCSSRVSSILCLPVLRFDSGHVRFRTTVEEDVALTVHDEVTTMTTGGMVPG